MSFNMDDIIDFIEDHKGLCITIAIVVILLIIGLCIRSHNLKNVAKLNEDIADTVEVTEIETEEEEPTTEAPKFVSDVGLREEEETEEETEPVDPDSLMYKEEESLGVFCKVIGHTVVPITNVDGSSCKKYLNSISVSDFDMYFGSPLTEEDMKASSYILIGTESDKNGDLQSTGWLIANLKDLDGNIPLYFSNLHIIGSLSNERTVLLCSYDWYSAFGLKDTLVLLEDISGTLNRSDYIDGDIISTVIWAKNIKIENVKGQNVVHIEYATAE